MVTEEYQIAYSEVLEILKYVPKEEYEKIDKEKLDFYEKNKKSDYNFSYDINKTLDEQGVSKIAKAIISIIYRDYWASEEERNEILEMQNKMRKNLKEKTQVDFDSNIAFKKNNDDKEDEYYEVSNMQMIEQKEYSFFQKILNKIKSIFKKD